MQKIFTKINKRRKMLPAFFVTLLFIFVSIFSSFSFADNAEAAINKQINYQGKLTTSAGIAVPNLSISIVFSLYTAPSGGVAIWTETQSVTPSDGIFSVMLGENTALTSVDFNQTLYLGVKVGTDSEMTPRKKLGVVPAAIEAENAQTAQSSTKATNLAGGNSSSLLGSIPYQSDTDTTSFVSPNVTLTKKFFTMTGTGTNGAIPTWNTVTATDVGLENVTNESKTTMFSSPTFTGTISGITATMVGLGNVTNESKTTMFSSPTFKGTVSGVTAAMVGLGDVPNLSFSGSNTGDETQTTIKTKLGSASAGVDGYLLGADWSTFNNASGSLVNYLPLAGGTMTGGITNSTSANPLTTKAESWIGPSSTTGVYFKSGNVGIGTTSPGYLLEVNGTAKANYLTDGYVTWGAAQFNRTSGFIEFQFTPTDINTGVRMFGNTSYPVVFQGTTGNVGIGYSDPGTAKLAIDGNVGIGTTAPGTALEVVQGAIDTSDGVAKFTNTMTVDGTANFLLVGKAAAIGHSALYGYRYDATVGDEAAVIGVWGDDITSGTGLYVRKGGNVGIGTTTPAQLLDIGQTTTDGTSKDALIRTSGRTSGGGTRSWDFGTATPNLSFYIKDTQMTDPALSILYGSGNVGIGTTTPASGQILHTYQSGNLGVRFESAGGWIGLGHNQAGGYERLITKLVVRSIGIRLLLKTATSASGRFQKHGMHGTALCKLEQADLSLVIHL